MKKVNTTEQDDPNKNETHESTTKIEYTGAGFMDYKQLMKIVSHYQQRHKLCEEVDFMEKISGKFSLN